MKTNSIWKEIKDDVCSKIKDDCDTDVLIVGGGITGLSLLYELRNSGLKTMLVERNRCGQGVTSRSTAKITFLQDNTITNIDSLMGRGKALGYLRSQIEATKRLANIIKKEKIDCDLKEVDSYVFTNDLKNLKKIETLYSIVEDCGVEVERVDSVPFDESFLDAIKVKGTYVFHPIKYLNHIKKLFAENIYEDSQVMNIDRKEGFYYSYVNGKTIRSKYVVLATHYPYFLSPLEMPLKSHIEVSYLGARKVSRFESFSAINIDKSTISMRYHSDGKDNYFVYLFNSFKSCDVKSIVDNFKHLKEKYDFDYIWSNNDIMTNDYMPYVGSIYKDENSFLIATGYNTWGITNGSYAGVILASIITGQKNEYIDLFAPKRGLNLSKVVRFPFDIGCNCKSFLKGGKKNVNNKNVEYTKMDGQNVVIYIDEVGISHIVLNKCPHMKCGVVLNEVEKTWDCLCHGSRFDIDGKCIEGPSNFDITFK